MIDAPKVGMAVTVDNPKCCCDMDENHSGSGVIIRIDDIDSFEVQMDDYPKEDWYRCRQCVTAI